MKKAALESVLTENEAMELIELAPRKVILVRKSKESKVRQYWRDNFLFKVTVFRTKPWRQNFYSKYSERRAFFWSNNRQFENFFSKSIKEHENMELKNKSVIGGWLLIPAKIYRRQKLWCRFEDWLYEKCRIKQQTFYN